MILDTLHKIRSAIFLKVLLVFVAAFTVVSTYFALTFWLVDVRRERPSLQATAVNYARYVLDDVGAPPDTARAREVGQRLGIGMRIEGPDLDWATTQEFPTFEEVDLEAYPDVPGARAGFAGPLGFSAEVSRGEYRYLLSLQAGGSTLASGSTDDVLDALFMLVVLVAVYVVTRRLLRPIRVLSDGVERLRAGDLDVEMPTERTDEFGRLIVSFNAMARTVRERIRARDQLLLDVSHEIRSPLTRMRVALEMMPESEPRSSVIQDIQETEGMIRELLETQRLDSPYGGLSKSRIDIAALVRDCVEVLADSPPGVDLKGADRPIHADVDPERFRILVSNVLSNALKYSDPNGRPVRIVLDAGDGSIMISFHDHGIGISSDDLAYVFEPFYRVDRSRSRDTGGYGIGLSLAKRIADAHGGSIELSSRVGEGTSVLVTLPVSGNGSAGGGMRW